MRFAKLHGLGNDFVLLDLRGGGEPPSPARAAALCDRHRGIGADGVLSLLPGDRLRIHNADGSVPEMCGNGARCAALWLATGGGRHAASQRLVLQTDAGPRPCAVEAPAGDRGEVEIEMGAPVHGGRRALPLGNERREAFVVSLGNPHRVLFVDGDPAALAAEFGPVLCRAEGANIEFVSRLAPGRYRAVVYERGAGLTQACGTGACAVAAAAIERGEARAGEEIAVELPGGALAIRLDPQSGQLRMRGPAQLVFTGEL